MTGQQHMGRGRWRGTMVAAALLLTTAAAQAVHPQHWTQQAEHDYAEGTFDNTVVDNFGELTLGREVKTVAVDGAVEFVNTFVQTPIKRSTLARHRKEKSTKSWTPKPRCITPPPKKTIRF